MGLFLSLTQVHLEKLLHLLQEKRKIKIVKEANQEGGKKNTKIHSNLSPNVKTYVNGVSKIELKDEGDSSCSE